MRVSMLFASVVVGLSACQAFAAPLLTYDFNFNPTSDPVAYLNPTATAAGVSGSAITAGSVVLTRDNFGSLPGTGSTVRTAGIKASNVEGTSEATSFASNDFFTFTLTPAAGQTLSLSGLSLDYGNAGADVRAFFVRSNLSDNFATTILTGSIPVGPASTTAAADFSALPQYQNLTGPVTFRVYGIIDTNPARTLVYDNIIVSGSVVPEPAALGLLGLAGLMLKRRR